MTRTEDFDETDIVFDNDKYYCQVKRQEFGVREELPHFVFSLPDIDREAYLQAVAIRLCERLNKLAAGAMNG